MGSNGAVADTDYRENKTTETHDQYLQKGVRHLCERGLTRVPTKYILPKEERPNSAMGGETTILKLPVIDFAQLQDSSSRSQALNSLAKACEEFGIFQVHLSVHIYMHLNSFVDHDNNKYTSIIVLYLTLIMSMCFRRLYIVSY